MRSSVYSGQLHLTRAGRSAMPKNRLLRRIARTVAPYAMALATVTGMGASRAGAQPRTTPSIALESDSSQGTISLREPSTSTAHGHAARRLDLESWPLFAPDGGTVTRRGKAVGHLLPGPGRSTSE